MKNLPEGASPVRPWSNGARSTRPLLAPRILIVRTDRIGDVILSTPVIRSLRRAFPDAYLGMMIRPEHRELVQDHPDLNAVILYDKEQKEKSWLGSLRFARELRAHRFDTAVILHSTNRVILVTWAAGIRRRIGYARRLPWLLTDRLPYLKREGTRHELDYNMELLKFLGISDGDRALHVPISTGQAAKVEAYLKSHGWKEETPLIAVHPSATCPSKRWPSERFAWVADRLIEQHGAQIVVVTGLKETSHGEEMLGKMRQVPIHAMGAFTLGELAALFKRCRALLSNDSGPVHLACAVGLPVVAIFGRWGGGLSETRWGPTNPNSAVLHHDVGCRPCLAHRCPIDFACLKAISAEEALTAVKYLASLEVNERMGE